MIESPTKNAIMPPSARNGPNGTAVLRPAACPTRAMMTTPTRTPVISAMKIAGATARPEVQAEHAGELHVPHPHAARVEPRREEEERERGGARDQLLGDEVDVECQAGDERRDRRGAA